VEGVEIPEGVHPAERSDTENDMDPAGKIPLPSSLGGGFPTLVIRELNVLREPASWEGPEDDVEGSA
jgi:hypothetical protein